MRKADIEILQQTDRAIEAQLVTTSETGAQQRLQRMRQFIASLIPALEVDSDGRIKMDFRGLAHLNSLIYATNRLIDQHQVSLVTLREYFGGIATYAEHKVHNQTKRANVEHSQLLHEMRQFMPWPRTFAEQLAGDLEVVNRQIANARDYFESVWPERARLLINGCLQAAAVVDAKDLPASTTDIAILANLERFAAAARQKDPAASKLLWEYLRTIELYKDDSFANQHTKAKLQHALIQMYLRSSGPFWESEQDEQDQQ